MRHLALNSSQSGRGSSPFRANALSAGAGIVATALILSAPVFALESDKGAPVSWQADGDSTMTVEDGIRVLTMEDNVIVSQGSLRISGDRAVFEYALQSNELTRITVQGSPVNYSQTLANGTDTVTGTSATLELYTESESGESEESGESIVELIGEASIESPDSSMRCAAIVYLVDRDLIREATGPCTGSLTSQSDE